MGRVQAGRCAADGTHKQISDTQKSRAGSRDPIPGPRCCSRVTVARFLCFVVRVSKAEGILHSLSLSTRRARHAAPTISTDMLFRGQVRLREPAQAQPAAAMAAALHRLFHTRIRTDLVGPIGLRHLCCSWITRHAGSIDGP